MTRRKPRPTLGFGPVNILSDSSENLSMELLKKSLNMLVTPELLKSLIQEVSSAYRSRIQELEQENQSLRSLLLRHSLDEKTVPDVNAIRERNRAILNKIQSEMTLFQQSWVEQCRETSQLQIEERSHIKDLERQLAEDQLKERLHTQTVFKSNQAPEDQTIQEWLVSLLNEKRETPWKRPHS